MGRLFSRVVVVTALLRSLRFTGRDTAGGPLIAGIVTRSLASVGLSELICLGAICPRRIVVFLSAADRSLPLTASDCLSRFMDSFSDASLSVENGSSRCLHFDVLDQNPPVAGFLLPSLCASSARKFLRTPVSCANPSKGPPSAMRINNPKQVKVRCMIGALRKRGTNLHASYRRISRVPISKNRRTFTILPVLRAGGACVESADF